MQQLWSAKLDLWSQHRDFGLWNHLTDADCWLPLHFALLWAAVSLGWVTACKTGIINKVAWGESLSTTDQTAGAASVHVQLKSGMHLSCEVWSVFKSRRVYRYLNSRTCRMDEAPPIRSLMATAQLWSLMKSCLLHKAASLSLEDYYCYSDTNVWAQSDLM